MINMLRICLFSAKNKSISKFKIEIIKLEKILLIRKQ